MAITNIGDAISPLPLSGGLQPIKIIETIIGAKRQTELIKYYMFSHVVIFWTKPENPKAADELLAGMQRYLKGIPGVLHFHAGKMVPSERPVVDQSYQVGLNIVFPDKKTQDAYQVHPLHVEFVEKVFKPNCVKVVVYDFEG